MKVLYCVAICTLCVLQQSATTSGTVTVTATPYESLPFPEGFKCQEEGVFPHRIHCEKYWLCQTDESGENLKPAELYRCQDGYLFDRTIQFCNKAEDVICSTMGKEKLAKALDIMMEAQRLELKLKEIEDHLKHRTKNIQKDPNENGVELSNTDNFVASKPESLISLIF